MKSEVGALDREAVRQAQFFMGGVAWATLVFGFAIVVGYGATFWAVAHGDLSLVTGFFVNGLLVYASYTILHETVHSNVSGLGQTTRWYNEVLGYVSGFMMAIPLTVHRATHLAHHRRTNDPEADPEELMSDDYLEDTLQSLVPKKGRYEIGHRTLYPVHQRVAETYHKGRVFLAGDAAHINNPLGGMGMNGGIHDAWNVVGKLVCVLQEGGDASSLMDHYDRQRRTIMNDFVQSQTIKNKRMIEEGQELAQQHEWDDMRRILGDDKLRRKFMLRQSMAQSLRDESLIE